MSMAWLPGDRREEARQHCHSGNANATYVPPLGAPFFPPPHAMTMYCRPFTIYVDGVALPAAGSAADQRSFPVHLSNARIVLSYVVAAMISRPFAVTIGPP